MSFKESTKLEAKRKAHFRCCLCEKIVPLDVHHIELESRGGSDELDNAVALCPTCHVAHGGEHMDDRTRKWIKEKRDWWYEHCEREQIYMQRIEDVYGILTNPVSGFVSKVNQLQSIAEELALQSNQKASRIPTASPDEIPTLITDLAAASGTLNVVTNAIVNLTDYIFVNCPKCKLKITFSKSNKFQKCPNCGFVMRDSRGTYYTV